MAIKSVVSIKWPLAVFLTGSRCLVPGTSNCSGLYSQRISKNQASSQLEFHCYRKGRQALYIVVLSRYWSVLDAGE